jgi:GDP-D-mannose 3', 5'-epimerase
MKYFVAGAGGFIGGHLVAKLLNDGHSVTCVDLKDIKSWFQFFNSANNISLDLRDINNCYDVVKGHDVVVNMACNMGGIGFIESNKIECMLSVLINTHLLMACRKYEINKYFFSSSACVYNGELQSSSNIKGLKEEDAYPALPEDGYGWEKLFSERMCRHFVEDAKIDAKVARYHNVYGPFGTYGGGREKSPAAICRKIINAKINGLKEIEVWGDGTQTRSYLFIEDCIEATTKLINSKYNGPINIGSEEQVSIIQLIDVVEKIANYKVKKLYKKDMPIGVKGRSSDNTKIKKELDWQPSFNLVSGLQKTYNWIYKDIKDNKEFNKYILA